MLQIFGRRFAVTFALCAWCPAMGSARVPAGAGWVQSAAPVELPVAETLIEKGEFEKAVKVLQDVLARPELAPAHRANLYRLLGLSQLYLGNQAKAREAYEQLLAEVPDFEFPDSAPPKIRRLYSQIREEIRSRSPQQQVSLRFSRIDEARAGQSLVVTAELQHAPAGARSKLYYRREGALVFNSVELVAEAAQGSVHKATIPGYELPASARGYQVEYFLEVTDAAGQRLTGSGDPQLPHSFAVAPLQGPARTAGVNRPWFKNPWIWAAGGAVAVGAGIGIAVLAQPPTGSLPITIREPK